MIILRNKSTSELKEVDPDVWGEVSIDPDIMEAVESEWEIIKPSEEALADVKSQESPVQNFGRGLLRGISSGALSTEAAAKGAPGFMGEMTGSSLQEAGITAAISRLHPAAGRLANIVIPGLTGMVQGAIEAPEGQGWEGALKGGVTGLAGQALAYPAAKVLEGVFKKVGRTVSSGKVQKLKEEAGKKAEEAIDKTNKELIENTYIDSAGKAAGKAGLASSIEDLTLLKAKLQKLERLKRLDGKSFGEISDYEKDLLREMNYRPHDEFPGIVKFDGQEAEWIEKQIIGNRDALELLQGLHGREAMQVGIDKNMREPLVEGKKLAGAESKRKTRRQLELEEEKIRAKHKYDYERYGHTASAAATGAGTGAASSLAAQLADPAIKDIPLKDVSPEQMWSALKRAVDIISSDDAFTKQEKLQRIAQAEDKVQREIGVRSMKTSVGPDKSAVESEIKSLLVDYRDAQSKAGRDRDEARRAAGLKAKIDKLRSML